MIGLTKGSRRRTECYVVTVGSAEVFFSYETPIGVIGVGRGGERVAVRRKNVWGPTTGRHMNEMGLRGAVREIEDEAEFAEILDDVITAQLLNRLEERLAA
jgi:hypothetical protein